MILFSNISPIPPSLSDLFFILKLSAPRRAFQMSTSGLNSPAFSAQTKCVCFARLCRYVLGISLVSVLCVHKPVCGVSPTGLTDSGILLLISYIFVWNLRAFKTVDDQDHVLIK